MSLNLPETRVTVTSIRLPFWNMVGLLVHLAVAAIPAIIILALVFYGALMLALAMGFGLDAFLKR
jgi:hypothetical protein